MTPGRCWLFCLWDADATHSGHGNRNLRGQLTAGWIPKSSSKTTGKDATKSDLRRDRFDVIFWQLRERRETDGGSPPGQMASLPRCTLRALWPSGPQGSNSAVDCAVRWRGKAEGGLIWVMSSANCQSPWPLDGWQEVGLKCTVSTQIDLTQNSVPCCSGSSTRSERAWQKPLL